MKVLVLGADGFIGRHIAFHLRAEGHQVIAQARRPDRLQAMGFSALKADLTDAACHDPGFWRPHLQDAHLINCAGLLSGTRAQFEAVHQLAPKAALAALTGRAVLISSVGIDIETDFARWRRATEDLFADHVILRPGLVLADTSYGGSSVLRALAALPLRTPVVGSGDQPFNPIHASDLARAVLAALALPPGLHEAGGPETVTQAELVGLIRRWLGLPDQPVWRIPLPLARVLGRLGDLLSLGALSATSVAQLAAGVASTPSPALPPARGVSDFVMARPAGTQDLWQARLYLVKPLIRLLLALMWLWSAALGLSLGPESFPGVEAPLWLARAGGLADLALGLALVLNLHPRRTALLQLPLVAAYTAGLTWLSPGLWADPFGGLMKNLPILALILAHLALAEER